MRFKLALWDQDKLTPALSILCTVLSLLSAAAQQQELFHQQFSLSRLQIFIGRDPWKCFCHGRCSAAAQLAAELLALCLEQCRAAALHRQLLSMEPEPLGFSKN